MPVLTRAQLHKLVWSEPATAIALRFEVSPTWISKLCKEADIPMPPQGHWAKSLATRKRARMSPLPLRSAGSLGLVGIGQDVAPYSRIGSADEEPPPPTFPETIEQIVSAGAAKFGPIRVPRTLSDPHPAMKRLLDFDDRRARKITLIAGHPFGGPLFSHPTYRRQLRIISCIFTALERAGGKPRISHQARWAGSGSVECLLPAVQFLDERLTFGFNETWAPMVKYGEPAAGPLALRIDGDKESLWTDAQGTPLETKVLAIARQMLVVVERSMRQHQEELYRECLRRRAEVEVLTRRQRAQEQERRDRSIAEARQQRIAFILAIAENTRRAKDLRAASDLLLSHPDSKSQSEEVALFREEIRSLAESIDPLQRPLGELLADFSAIRAR
jgi:hypothetical protein